MFYFSTGFNFYLKTYLIIGTTLKQDNCFKERLKNKIEQRFYSFF